MAFLYTTLFLSLPASRIPFWPFVITLLLLSAILYTRAVNSNNWTLVLRSLFSPRAVQQLIREENTLENSFSGLLVLTFFFSLALFFYNVNEVYQLTAPVHPLLAYFITLTGVFLVYLVKAASLYVFQLIFESQELFEEYLVGLMNINIVLGAFLIPLNLMLSYGVVISKPTLIFIGLLLLIISFVFRFVRLFEMGARNNVKSYNIILYLCTLEIMPIVAFIKLLDNFGINLNLL